MGMTVFCCLFLVTGLFAANTDTPLPEGDGVEGVFQAGKRQISGTVVDETGEPVIGANVMEKGTTNGIVTDVDGHFSLSVSGGAVLQVSYIGYVTQDVPTGNGSSFNIRLVEDTKALDEVVVIGYGTQRKANLTGAVATVNSDVIEDRPITNLGAGLQGAIANLNITSSNGAPGQGASFNIRGTTNFAGGGPLVLVDGIEMDPNLINPQDVKDVTILKDAASAAIYGARAAFGVILITTKSGFVTQKPIVSFNANYSFNTPTVHPTYMSSLEYAKWMNDANMTTNGVNYFDDLTMQYITAYYNDPANNPDVFHHPSDAANTYRFSGNTDWYKTLNKSSYPIQQYNTSIQGGSEDVKYFTSAGFFQQDGISKWADEDFKRINVLQNITYKAADWIQVGLRTTLNIIDQNSGGQNKYGDSSMGSTIPGDSRPTMPLYYPNGHFAGYSGDGYFTNLAAWQSQGGFSKLRKNDIWATGTLKLTPFEGFAINMDYTYNYYIYSFKNFVREYWDYDADGPAVIFPHTSPNSVSHARSESQYDVFNAYAEYEKKFAGKHQLKAMVGFNQEGRTNRGVSLSRANLISNEIPYLALATGERTTNDSEEEWRIRGAFFRLNYIFDDKYLLEINGRYDGSSRFPKKDRFEFFPSISAGWRVSNEHFWNPLRPVINDFKLRGSYGSLGNQTVSGYYPYISSYGTGQVDYLFGGEKQMAVYSSGLVSDLLTWETVSQYDFGFDISLLDSKLTGTFDYYQRDTKNMLTKSKTLPAVLGTSEPQANAADLRTRGWEASITWANNLSNGLKYTTSFIMSDYQAEITKYDNPTKNISDYYVGQKLGEIWGFVTDGFFKTDEEAASWDQSKVVGYKQLAGDIKFADIDGKPGVDYGESTVANPGDRKIIGNNTPRYSFGIRGTGEWHNFDLTFFFQGIMKRDIIAGTAFYLNHYTSQWAVPQKMNADYWREDNQDAFFPRARLNGSAVNINQTHFLQNASYIRLKQLALGYTIPAKITQKAHISKLRIYFNADNLWEYSSMPKTFDPELAVANAYPFIRSYSFGLNLNF
jgi:TonB-linked SusC/RagA family outer membrane protein